MLEQIKARPSAKVLILANLLPLFGVIFLGWSVFNIVLLYWMENLVIGGINILKMITCRPDVDEMQLETFLPAKLQGEQRDEILGKLEDQGGIDAAMRGHSALKFFMVPFFTLHYFGFCAGHGFFVFSLFGGDAGIGRVGTGLLAPFGQIPQLLSGTFALAALGLVVSHLYSFFSNYLRGGEYKRTIVPILMFKPYARIVVLHIAIIFGGFVVMALNSPLGLLVILIIGKIVIDLKMHLLEHSQKQASRIGSPLIAALIGRGKS